MKQSDDHLLEPVEQICYNRLHLLFLYNMFCCFSVWVCSAFDSAFDCMIWAPLGHIPVWTRLCMPYHHTNHTDIYKPRTQQMECWLVTGNTTNITNIESRSRTFFTNILLPRNSVTIPFSWIGRNAENSSSLCALPVLDVGNNMTLSFPPLPQIGQPRHFSSDRPHCPSTLSYNAYTLSSACDVGRKGTFTLVGTIGFPWVLRKL